MRDTILILLTAALLLTVLAGCSRQSDDPAPTDSTSTPLEPSIEPDATGDENIMPQTGWTTAVPNEYFEPSDHPGTVTRLDYESEDYVRDGAAVTKTAYVYTPYGYDAADTETRYNILYLMHGWGGRAGEYFDYGQNLFDNLIERGDIPPLIIVSATFYNDNISRDFGSSIQEFREFHRDFEAHLMPAVEGQYHTYAQSTSSEDLAASRGHRAFGGFSLGSVTTWLQFCYDYDYIRWFLPMSGSCFEHLCLFHLSSDLSFLLFSQAGIERDATLFLYQNSPFLPLRVPVFIRKLIHAFLDTVKKLPFFIFYILVIIFQKDPGHLRFRKLSYRL